MSYFDVFGELGDAPPPPPSAPAAVVTKVPPSASSRTLTDAVNGNDGMSCDQCAENGVGGGDGAVDRPASVSARSNDATPTPPDGSSEDPPKNTPEDLTASESPASGNPEVSQDPPSRTEEPSCPKLAPDGRRILPRLRLTSIDGNGEAFDLDDDVFFSGGPLEEPLEEEDDSASTPDTDITEAAELTRKDPPADDNPWSSHLPMRLFRDGWHGLSNLLVSIHHHRRASDG